MDIRDEWINKALKKGKKKIIYGDGEDPRGIKAADEVIKKGLGEVTLVGNPTIINTKIKELGATSEINVVDPAQSPHLDELAEYLYQRRKHKGLTLDEAKELIKKPLYYTAAMVATGKMDISVAGSISTTADVLRAYLHLIDLQPGISLVSSSLFIVLEDKIFLYADPAVNPDPTSEQLADIGITSAKIFESLTGQKPYVAFLSFSTYGSAKHPMVEKVQKAVQIAKAKAPDITIDGEMQFDAAISPEVGQRKAPGSPVAGKANVLIFPDLNAANIGYKISQWLAGAQAIGPILQGFSLPVFDLSRGCKYEDIVLLTAIGIILSN